MLKDFKSEEVDVASKAETPLEKIEKQYKFLFTNLKIGVIKQGLDSEILLSNPAALEMLGLTEDQLLGRTSFHPEWNIIHENGDDYPNETYPVPIALATKKPVNNVIMGVYRHVTKDRVWLLVNAEPELDSMGEVEYVICTFNNITEQILTQKELEKNRLSLVKLNEELQLKTADLMSMNIELERFAYVASHDLKQPLRMVISFMELLESKYANILDEKGKQYINYAVDAAEKMRLLITDLLNYSHAGDGHKKLEEVDMNTIVEDVCSLFSNEIFDSNAKISLEKLPTIKASKTAMTQLMQNLIENAIKYKSDIKAEILVYGEENENEWIISVQDNGIGIAEENIEKVFVMFQRVVTKTKISGTGIGLASCKKIVESFNGRIWVESELGIGSIFKFSIPKNK